MPDTTPPSGRFVLSSMGWLCLVAAALFGADLAAALAPYPEGLASPRFEEALTRARVQAAMLGVTTLGLGVWVARYPGLQRTVGRLRWVIALLFPLVLAELLLRPYVPERARIFEPDSALGWKLKPGEAGVWGGSLVKVNQNGLRGPERDYRKPEGTSRILALGDSVTFGFSLPYHDTFVARLEERLRNRGERVEVINAGVGGYSPWQHERFLAHEGLRYDPDLVLLSLTLNDVDEKFTLERFGGRFAGVQLMASDPPPFLQSGIVFSIWFPIFFQMQAAETGPPEPVDLQDLHTADVIWNRSSPWVAKGWQITLENLQPVVDLCRDHDLPLVIAVFPFLVQFDAPGLDSAQRPFLEFAEQNGVPAIDMVPALRAWARAHDAEVKDLFLDMSHLSPKGSRVAADLILAEIDAHGGL